MQGGCRPRHLALTRNPVQCVEVGQQVRTDGEASAAAVPTPWRGAGGASFARGPSHHAR